MDRFQPLDNEERELIDLIEMNETHPVSKEEEQQVLAAVYKPEDKSK